MSNVEDIFLYILTHHKPRTSTETQSLTLADSMEPQAFMLANPLACFQLYNVTRLFTQITPNIVVVIDLP